jgi:pyruvate,water dikinase
MQRAVTQRHDAEKNAESRLSAEKLEQFRELARQAQAHVRISESRAFWQLTIDGSLRPALLAVGKKLADLGVIGAPDDVMFLHLSEIQRAAESPEDMRALVERRREDLARWEKLTPPDSVGGPRKDQVPPSIRRNVERFWGGEVAPSSASNVINGNAAAKGIARGKARIIGALSDAHLLQTGEILVCRSTAPPWTPLFAIASAVVTDTGGILSHSAICAREYGIPCVAGTRVGTERIPNGALITVDGGAGTVTIEA